MGVYNFPILLLEQGFSNFLLDSHFVSKFNFYKSPIDLIEY